MDFAIVFQISVYRGDFIFWVNLSLTNALLILLFRLVHFGVPLLFYIFGGAGRADEYGVHNAVSTHHPSGLLQTAFMASKNSFPIPCSSSRCRKCSRVVASGTS